MTTVMRDVRPDPARDSALTRAVQQIEKQFGKGSVMRLDGEDIRPIDGIPTGSLSLDIALGGAGIPRGRIAEVFGPESRGKTTLALHVIASIKIGGVAAFIDAEHARSLLGQAAEAGRSSVSQPDTGEQALEICEAARSFQRAVPDRHRLRRRSHPARGNRKARWDSLPGSRPVSWPGSAHRRISKGAPSSSSTRSARRSA
jgi:hypothetical protein